MHFTLVNLLGVAIVAFCVPFIVGFFARVRIPAVALELIAGIIVGPAVLLLGVFFAGNQTSAAVSALLLTVVMYPIGTSPCS